MALTAERLRDLLDYKNYLGSFRRARDAQAAYFAAAKQYFGEFARAS